jgi:hypothetical protein
MPKAGKYKCLPQRKGSPTLEKLKFKYCSKKKPRKTQRATKGRKVIFEEYLQEKKLGHHTVLLLFHFQQLGVFLSPK